MTTSPKRKLLYVAAPYTYPDPVENTHWVGRVGMEIYQKTDYLPFIPHLNLAWHLIVPRSPHFWYDLDFEYLKHCDTIVRLPGKSPGADAELEYARENGMEIIEFDSLPEEAQTMWLDWITLEV